MTKLPTNTKTNQNPQFFHYNNLFISLNNQVYNPAEDTFLLLETIKPTTQDTILEIGTGCGIIALHCAQHGSKVIATDINPHALQLTQNNIKKNTAQLKGAIYVARGNLLDFIHPNSRFDIIIFNPPYLPTTHQEKIPGWINYAYDGGTSGTKTIKAFLHQVPQHMKKNSICYFVGSSLQNHKLIISTIHKKDMKHTIIKKQLIGDEYLQIHQLQKN